MNLRRIQTLKSWPLHIALPAEWGRASACYTAKSDRPAADHWKKRRRADERSQKCAAWLQSLRSFFINMLCMFKNLHSYQAR